MLRRVAMSTLSAAALLTGGLAAGAAERAHAQEVDCRSWQGSSGPCGENYFNMTPQTGPFTGMTGLPVTDEMPRAEVAGRAVIVGPAGPFAIVRPLEGQQGRDSIASTAGPANVGRGAGQGVGGLAAGTAGGTGAMTSIGPGSPTTSTITSGSPSTGGLPTAQGTANESGLTGGQATTSIVGPPDELGTVDPTGVIIGPEGAATDPGASTVAPNVGTTQGTGGGFQGPGTGAGTTTDSTTMPEDEEDEDTSTGTGTGTGTSTGTGTGAGTSTGSGTGSGTGSDSGAGSGGAGGSP